MIPLHVGHLAAGRGDQQRTSFLLKSISMGQTRQPRRVLLLCGVFSQFPSALSWARERLEQDWGPIAMASQPFDFLETRFYEPTMGSALKKQWLAFQRLVDPANLADLKILSNRIEKEYRRSGLHNVTRPLNLDPGYLTEAKLVLATTKNREHRIYLRDGILAEITLYFQDHQWKSSRWTYPDYRRSDLHQFLTEARNRLRQAYQASPNPEQLDASIRPGSCDKSAVANEFRSPENDESPR